MSAYDALHFIRHRCIDKNETVVQDDFTMTESNHLKMLQASERCEYNIVKGAEDVDYRRGLQHETQP